MKKTPSTLVLAGLLTFSGAGAANAVESYPPPAPGGVSNATVTPGASITFSGTGFEAAEAISIAVEYYNDPVVVPGTGLNSLIIMAQPVNSFTTTATASGEFSTGVSLGEAGTYALTATGLTSGHAVTAAVSVDPAFTDDAATESGAGGESSEDTGGIDLASTGAESAMLLWGAAGILALGGGVTTVAIARRKNT